MLELRLLMIGLVPLQRPSFELMFLRRIMIALTFNFKVCDGKPGTLHPFKNSVVKLAISSGSSETTESIPLDVVSTPGM